MPNYCENTLTISGDLVEQERFKIKAFHAPKDPKDKTDDVSHLSFANFLPCPDPENWYDWNCKHWGTKWDACGASEPQRDGEQLQYYFDTAWSPPLPFILAVSKLYPKLSFLLEYEDPGMCFSGEYEASNGQVLRNDYRDEIDSAEDDEQEPNRFCEKCYFSTPNISTKGKIDCQNCGYKEV